MSSIPALRAETGSILALTVLQTARITEASHALLATPALVADALATFTVSVCAAVQIATF